MKTPEKAPEEKASVEVPEEPKEPEAPKASAEALEPPKDRETLDAMVKEYGVDAAVEALTKVRVVDLRSLAREYNGEFGIAGREIRNANKKVLIEEFRKFFSE